MKLCKVCAAKFKPQRTTQQVCSPKCAYKLVKQKKQQAVKKKKEDIEQLKTKSQKIQDARRVFQLYIRERDKDLPCISCGTITSKVWDAGHYLKAELYTGLIFNEDNCHKQCRKCNRYLGGNEIEYRMGLIERIGADRVEDLERRRDQFRLYKYSDEELKALILKFKAKKKEI